MAFETQRMYAHGLDGWLVALNLPFSLTHHFQLWVVGRWGRSNRFNGLQDGPSGIP